MHDTLHHFAVFSISLEPKKLTPTIAANQQLLNEIEKKSEPEKEQDVAANNTSEVNIVLLKHVEESKQELNSLFEKLQDVIFLILDKIEKVRLFLGLSTFPPFATTSSKLLTFWNICIDEQKPP